VKRAAQSGFTLIELVLAVSLLAAMLGMAWGGFSFALRAWDAGENGGHRAADLRLAEVCLRLVVEDLQAEQHEAPEHEPAQRPARAPSHDLTGIPAHQTWALVRSHAPQSRGIFPNLSVDHNLDVAAYLPNYRAPVAKYRDHALGLFPRLPAT